MLLRRCAAQVNGEWARRIRVGNAVGTLLACRSPSCGNIQGLNNARPMPCCSFHTQLDKTSVFEI